jgi:hypothetical protein
LFDAMLALARSPTSRVDLIGKMLKDGLARGWFYDRVANRFQSDRQVESVSANELAGLAGSGSEVTFTLVPRGTGMRLGIDRDLDGSFDRDELDRATNPEDRSLLPRIISSRTNVAVGTDLTMEAQLPPLPAPGEVTWWKDGHLLAGATNETFTLGAVQFEAAGNYRIVVTTPYQAWTSAPVRLTVAPLVIEATPTTQSARRGSNAMFAAVATGIGPFEYQWRFNEQEIPGATAASLAVSNVQVADEGAYRVSAANAFGAATSAPVNLGVLVNPSVVLRPLNQSAVAGDDVTFSVMISGHPPPFGYQLRRSTVTLTNYTSDEREGFLTLFNVQPGNAGSYRIIVTNAANPAPGLALDPVSLTVLADFDHDGLPDTWEAANGLGTNNSADAVLDFDSDGQTNADEYIAGTDPWNSQSVLKVARAVAPDGEKLAVLEFHAIANKTYSIQARDSFTSGAWTTVANIVATPGDRFMAITNSFAGTSTRYYRLVTPRVP